MWFESRFFIYVARGLILWMLLSSVAYAVDPYTEARSISQSVRPATTGSLFDQAAAQYPFPDPVDPVQASEFSDDHDPSLRGSARIVECGAATLDPNNPAHMECFAVNTAAQSNIDASAGPPQTDSMFVRSRLIQAAPNTHLNNLGFTISATEGMCSPETMVESASFTDQCIEGRNVDEAWCSYDLDVQVATANRSCTRAVNGSCSITPPPPVQVCSNTWQQASIFTCRMEGPTCSLVHTECIDGYWDPIYAEQDVIDPETGEVVGTETVQVGETWVCTMERDDYICRTIVHEQWINNCGGLETNPRCDLENAPDPEEPGDVPEVTCTDSATRVINGLPVSRCWSQSLPFGCITDEFVLGCGAHTDLGCTQSAERYCASYFPATKRGLDGVIVPNPFAGECEYFATPFLCPLDTASKGVDNCEAKEVCVDDGSGNIVCWGAGHEGNQQDFLAAAAAMEFAREAGTYLNPDTLRLFSASAERCRYRNKGISIKCCSSAKGAKSNHDVISSLTWQVAMNGIDYVWYKSAPYVYDFMYSTTQPFLSAAGLEGWASNAMTGVTYNPSISFYGFTFATKTPTIPLIGGQIPGTTTLATNIGGTNFNLYFNPYMFALMLLLYIYFELTSCTEAEQMLAMKRGSDLCTQVARRCSGRILKTCRRHYCCYNSRLAKIIGDAGRAQLGTGRSCAGLTPAEFQSLNFAAIDFRPFYNDLLNATGQPGPDFALQRLIEQMSAYD